MRAIGGGWISIVGPDVFTFTTTIQTGKKGVGSESFSSGTYVEQSVLLEKDEDLFENLQKVIHFQCCRILDDDGGAV